MCLFRLSDLVSRFEVPDSRNRWDSPIFTVHATDSVPFDQVHQVLYHRVPAPPNLSTLPVSIKHLLRIIFASHLIGANRAIGSTPCPEKNGTNNVLGITLANTNI